MERSLRIAVVGRVDERLLGDLRRLPLGPDVRAFDSLLGDGEALLRLEPDALWLAIEDEGDEAIGAVRMLQRLWPTLGVVVVTPPDRELALARTAQRLHARLCVYPDAPGQLAALLEQMVHGGDRPRPELFVDLAHGLADEINNPLLFCSGHLQLLRAAFDPASERDRRDQVDAVLQGLSRIQGSVDRLRLLSQAADGPHRRPDVDLGALVAHAIAARPAGVARATVQLPPGPQPVPGDPEQLQAAITAIVAFADDLAAQGAQSHFELTTQPKARRLRLTAVGPGLQSWLLPRSFEPYYPQRVLRGQGLGLGLFLAQTVVLGHGGQATARRLLDGTLAFEFALPLLTP